MGVFESEGVEIAFLRSSYQDFDKFKKYFYEKNKKSSEKGRRYINSLKKRCFFCDSTENLSFYAKNPLLKRPNVNRMVKNSEKTIDEEVRRCWCVCPTCKNKLKYRLLDPLPEFWE